MINILVGNVFKSDEYAMIVEWNERLVVERDFIVRVSTWGGQWFTCEV